MKAAAIEWKPRLAAFQNARRVLPQLLRDYFSSGRKLGPNSAAGEMHAFRLETKRLRYTLEAFASLYGTEFKNQIERLRPIQNALGELNDCDVMLSEFEKRLTPALRAHVRKRADARREEFLRYWREEFDAAGEDTRWMQLLTRSPRLKTAT